MHSSPCLRSKYSLAPVGTYQYDGVDWDGSGDREELDILLSNRLFDDDEAMKR